MQRTVRFSFTLIFILLTGIIFAQNRPIGSWRGYFNHDRGIAGAEKNGVVYALTEGGMFGYDRTTGDIQTFSTIEGMSNLDGSSLYYAPESDRIYIGYENGLINYFEEPGDFLVWSDINRNQSFTDKRINDFYEAYPYVYVATNFGLVVFDQRSGLPVADVAQFGNNPSRLPVLHVTVFDGYIWLVVETAGLYRIPVDFPNLRDPLAWSEAGIAFDLKPDAQILDVDANSEGLFALTTEDFYRWQDGQWQVVSGALNEKDWFRLHTTGVQYGVSSLVNNGFINNQGIGYFYSVEREIVDAVLSDQSEFYNITRFDGVIKFDDWSISTVRPNGPFSNTAIKMEAGNGILYVGTRGYDKIFIPQFTADGLYKYDANDDNWTIFNDLTGRVPESIKTSLSRVKFDKDNNRIYVGSWGQGIFVMEDTVIVDSFTCEDGLPTVNGNCDLTNIINTRVSGLDLDPAGNLWASFHEAQTPLAVKPVEGDWVQIPSSFFPSGTQVVDMIVDAYGTAWMITQGKGLLAYTANNTFDDFVDGRALPIRSGSGVGGLPTNQVFSIAEDKDGFIWIGTSEGVGVIYDPFSVSQGVIVDASRPIQNGSQLLKRTSVFTIAIDGGNRKWFGTNEGVFLISPDGDEQILNFTTENSPLPSNRIENIAIDQETGEVFIATDKGIVSYISDATESPVACTDVFVYPNPVLSEEDQIVIRGAGAESQVRIVSVSGKLVRQIEAQGGTAVWDGRDVRGNRVASGVYLALIADNDGQNGCVGKFTVISQRQ
ncbi:MAG: two-component regulator propeller domain-containing protein [Bacteroidota bacterium]